MQNDGARPRRCWARGVAQKQRTSNHERRDTRQEDTNESATQLRLLNPFATMQSQNKQPEKDLTSLSPVEAIEVLKTHLVRTVKEKRAALEEVNALKRSINDMKVELDSNRNIISRFVNEKIQTEAKLLMNMDVSRQGHLDRVDSYGADVHHLQEQLAEANVMVLAQKETVAKLLEENQKLLAQKEEQEKVLLENASLQRENDELKQKLDKMGGEDVAMLADFLQDNEELLGRM